MVAFTRYSCVVMLFLLLYCVKDVLALTDFKLNEETVSFLTKDGVKIFGSLYLPGRTKGKVSAVLLLHQLGKDRRSWNVLIPNLLKEKYVVLAIDLRGHGDSTTFDGKPYFYSDFSNSDYALMIEDVRSAVEYLKSRGEVRADRIGIIGASIGANLALQYASEDRNVRTVILLSPGENYRGLEILPFLEAYSRRALLIVVSEKDTYSLVSSQKLKEHAVQASPCKLKIYPGGLHGTDLMNISNGLPSIIVAWLQNHLPNG